MPRPAAVETGAPLEFEGVRKTFQTHFWQRPVTSLDGLDLEIREGEILGLLGPNGAGKTTTIKLALGLIFPDQGSVRLMGCPAERPSARAQVGYLPENPYFPDDLSGRELIHFAGRLHGLSAADRRHRAELLLEQVGLSAAADRPLRKYSKGMVQRAGMARALVGSPRFIILDEPMSGLDPVGRRQFRDMILKLREQGTTVLFASHVLSDAEMLCDRVAILRAGRLLAMRDLGGLEEERAILGWEVAVMGGGSLGAARLVAERGEERLWRFSAEARPDGILSAIEGAGAKLQALRPQRETLEELFLRTLSDAEEDS